MHLKKKRFIIRYMWKNMFEILRGEALKGCKKKKSDTEKLKRINMHK